MYFTIAQNCLQKWCNHNDNCPNCRSPNPFGYKQPIPFKTTQRTLIFTANLGFTENNNNNNNINNNINYNINISNEFINYYSNINIILERERERNAINRLNYI